MHFSTRVTTTRHSISGRWLALGILGVALTGCANMERHAPLAATQSDDDAYCRKNGVAQGSNAYVECRKDRDVARGNTDDKLERQHRNMAERMLNGQ